MGIETDKRSRAKFFIARAYVVVFIFGAVFAGESQTLGDALDSTNFIWTTGGDAAWFAETTNTYDGVDAVQSGPVYSSQTSWIETTVVGPATISFWVLSERNGQINWRFTINDPGPPYPVTVIYLPVEWHQQIYDLGEGTNVLRWTVNGLPTNPAAGFVVVDEFVASPPRPLIITSQPFDQTIYSGAQIGLYASAIGTPPIYYQWSKDGTNIADATNSWFALNQAITNDSGIYFVTVSNSQDQVVSSNAVVTVLPPTAPFFTLEPADATVYTGQNFQWYASVNGSPPFTYTWRKDEALIQTGTNGAYGYSYFSLVLTDISGSDAANYRLAVTNDYGGIESSNLVLAVIQSVPPVITRQPRSLEVAEGVNTWMSMAATGVPGPYYTWTGPNSPPPSPLFPPPPGGLGSDSTLHRFINATTNDAGIYFATITNYTGETNSWNALLTVLPAITNVGSWEGDAVDIFVTNNLAFLARGTNGLAILDVGNPASPQLLGSFNNNYASKVVVSDDLAYVATGSSGLEILSVTNPANPVLLDTYVTPGSANDVVVRSNLAYVADGSAGLLILNVSNTASPLVVGSYKTNFNAYHICLSGNYAILSSPYINVLNGTNVVSVGGLFVVDVSDPTHPSEISRLSTRVGNLDARDQCVFGVVQNGLSVISITNPAQPMAIGTFNSYYSTNGYLLPGIYATDVRMMNDRVFVTANSGDQSQLYVLDTRDPTELIPVGYYTNSGQFSTLAVNGNWVFLAGDQTPLQIIETPFDTNPIGLPALSVSALPGVNLQIHGRHGWHYDVEYTPQLGGAPWQTLQTVLLTNDNATVLVPSSSAAGFFRLKQRD